MSNETKPKLLPCPFCGETTIIVYQDDDDYLWCAQCTRPGCNANQWWHEKAEVVSMWNRRVLVGPRPEVER